MTSFFSPDSRVESTRYSLSSSSSMNIRKQAKRPLFPSEVDNIYTNFNKTKLILFSHRLPVLDVGFIVIIQTKTTPNRIKTSLKTINTAACVFSHFSMVELFGWLIFILFIVV